MPDGIEFEDYDENENTRTVVIVGLWERPIVKLIGPQSILHRHNSVLRVCLSLGGCKEQPIESFSCGRYPYFRMSERHVHMGGAGGTVVRWSVAA